MSENGGNGKLVQLTAKDFKSDQEVRWCPGCGDYAILAAMQSFMPELGLPREKIVFISGIGCAARFPYYMQTYGMHSIHGRAPAIATGLSTSRPDLSVWVVTGDGDALSIGGNHLIHVLRRNVNVKILLFNNQIYGLTKGQYSPTSPLGTRNKSTPMGSLDYPFNPVSIALGAEATFVARSIDTDKKHLTEVLRRAASHKGTALVEIYQNCNVYNDGAFDAVKEQTENQIRLVHGEPIRFGAEDERGVKLRDGRLVRAGLGGRGRPARARRARGGRVTRVRAVADLAHAARPDADWDLPRRRAPGLRRIDGRAAGDGDRGAWRGRPEVAHPRGRHLGRLVERPGRDACDEPTTRPCVRPCTLRRFLRCGLLEVQRRDQLLDVLDLEQSALVLVMGSTGVRSPALR